MNRDFSGFRMTAGFMALWYLFSESEESFSM
jgi:hypothetical protein